MFSLQLPLHGLDMGKLLRHSVEGVKYLEEFWVRGN
jgi:hypothetical protein